MAELGDSLRAEYALLQSQYEAFDQRALTIKSWSAPLLAGGLGLGLKDDSLGLVIATALASVCLWWLEAIWKTFQYCYIARIDLLEQFFRGEADEATIRPFQIRNAWIGEWNRWFHSPLALWHRIKEPFVFLPYLPLLLACIAGSIWLSLTPRPQ